MPEGTDRYLSDPGDRVKQLEERIRALEQSVRALGSRNPLNNAVFRGTLRNVDGSNNTLVVISPDGLSTFDPGDGLPRQISGSFSDGASSFIGWVIYDGDGKSVLMTRNDKGGLIKPDIPAPFVKANDFTAVTSATFVPTANYNPRSLYFDVLRVAVVVASDASTTGEIRLTETVSNTSTTALTTTAGTQQTAIFEWLHGFSIGDDPGANVAFAVEAKRTTGTGDINVYVPNEVVWTSSALVSGATSSGNAHFA